MRITDTGDLWWKTAVIYCLDVETFMDWNDDGMGDFAGLAERLDYLAELGVTCLWLMPFYPTARPRRRLRHHRLLRRRPAARHAGDFVEVVRTARDRGMRVIVDLVVNHTSDKHPWFRAARSSTDLAVPRLLRLARRPAAGHHEARSSFPDKENSIWEYDEKTGEWYLHRFYRTQPDLNITNPRVRDEIVKVDGLLAGARDLRLPGRRRAVHARDRPASTQAELTASPTRTSTCAQLRSFVGPAYRRRRSCSARSTCRTRTRRRSSAASDGDELTMQFDFIGMQNLYLVAGPRRTPARWRGRSGSGRPISPESQWATFVRNHDELTLDKLSDDERARGVRRLRPGPGRCSSTAAACAAGCRRCSTATRAGSGWSTACCSPCPAPRCCSTARRSGWARTSTSRAGSPCARRCSGPTGATAASPAPRRRRLRRPVVDGRLRARARQRRRPAQRPRLAAVLHRRC